MTQPTKYNVLLVGCGKMGTAMIHGWMGADLLKRATILDPEEIHDSLMIFQSLFHVKQAADIDFSDIDMVTLAVKPQIMTLVCEGLNRVIPDSLKPTLPILSIAAGKDTPYFKTLFGEQTPVIRAMPNTPAAIGRGVSALYATPNVTPAQKTIASDLLGALGKTLWLDDENKMDAVTAVSGSGPAYVFYLIEAMASAGEKAGLAPDDAMMLARQTVIGSAALAAQEHKIPASILRQNVTSPGGTTEAALSVLMDGKFQDIMDEAIAVATQRSNELSN